jgi:hypothetical protein
LAAVTELVLPLPVNATAMPTPTAARTSTAASTPATSLRRFARSF